MKKIILPVMLMCILTATAPAYAFLDYLFGGSSNKDAIDNSAIGDLRAWWTGNPAYEFNPYYSPRQQNPVQGQAPQAAPQVQQPNVTYYPPQGAQQPYYGQSQPTQQGMTQQYATPGYQQAAPVQQYQAAPQQYQPAPQSYPVAQQPAQYPAQAYQQPAPQQQYQQPAPQGYPARSQYPASPSY